jgi:DNA polymerase-3 subunit beta
MLITFQREEFLKPLSHVAGVAERRQTLPILSYVLLQHRDGKTTLTGTDLEVEISTVSPAAAKGAGEMTVPARKLLEICRALPEGSNIELRQEGEKAIVKAGRSRFSLLTMPVADFPALQTPPWEQALTLKQGELKGVLEQTQFCMAQQDVRYYLNGVLLELGSGKLRVVATDGHRMAVSDLAVADAAGEKQVIVPRKAVQEITRLLSDSDEPVTLQLGQNHVGVQTAELVFTSKLIDGRYPDYHKVIPGAQAVKIRMEAPEFQKALTRVAILSSEKHRGVRLSAEKTVRITAHNPEQEEAQEEIVALEHSGPVVEIGFNVSYLLDAVSAVGAGEIVFTMNDANSSCTVRPASQEYPLYVIMPMRL